MTDLGMKWIRNQWFKKNKRPLTKADLVFLEEEYDRLGFFPSLHVEEDRYLMQGVVETDRGFEKLPRCSCCMKYIERSYTFTFKHRDPVQVCGPECDSLDCYKFECLGCGKNYVRTHPDNGNCMNCEPGGMNDVRVPPEQRVK